ncbi:HD domain-containing protein [Frankia sp. QA3]|uniref:HD domain-containing protein n=1 Tax=Frankia sp. QA3 TaxID=710111 RepID=UPI000269CF0C|nr:HD domain-containing protein [Frankia sp. QA3]EIV95834.1 guanosine polyphosphate synthetase/pyrophosphohydrolase [Frankia sp. QA3]
MPSTTPDAAAPDRPGASPDHGATAAPTLDDAIAFATRVHSGQIDKGGEEYIGHPLRVMATVARTAEPAGVDPHTAQLAAVLHDVVEDSDTTLADLTAAGYPAPVVAAVDALSHRPDESTRDYLARVAADPLAVVVKRADMQDNSDPVRLGRLAPDQAERLATRYAGRRELLDDLISARTGRQGQG